MHHISWNDREAREDTIDGVNRLLDGLHDEFRRGDPTLVTVARGAGGDSLSIGLGNERSVLNYVRGDGNPPYYTSAGGDDTDEMLSFRFGGEWSEFPLRYAIPTAAARAAMTHFCETGALWDAVAWEEVLADKEWARPASPSGLGSASPFRCAPVGGAPHARLQAARRGRPVCGTRGRDWAGPSC